MRYADDLAMLVQRPSWNGVEDLTIQDMSILADYHRNWLSIGKKDIKTVCFCNADPVRRNARSA